MKSHQLLPLFVVALGLSLATVVSATPILYTATLSGPAESPANSSLGTGFATVAYDFTTHIIEVSVSFSGLSGTTTASHIHAATAVAGMGTALVATQTPSFAGFPLGVTSGTYDHFFDLSLASSWNPAYITAHGGTIAGAETDFAAALDAGTAYYNIHTSIFPGGEIRGFLSRVPSVPDSASTLSLLSLALLGLASFGRFVRRT